MSRYLGACLVLLRTAPRDQIDGFTLVLVCALVSMLPPFVQPPTAPARAQIATQFPLVRTRSTRLHYN